MTKSNSPHAINLYQDDAFNKAPPPLALIIVQSQRRLGIRGPRAVNVKCYPCNVAADPNVEIPKLLLDLHFRRLVIFPTLARLSPIELRGCRIGVFNPPGARREHGIRSTE